MLNALRSSLGSGQHPAVAQLARHICKEPASQPLEKTIIALLRDGHTMGRLMAALLHCESVRIKMLFAGHSSLPLKVQIDNLRQAVHGFNAIQDAILETGSRHLNAMHAQSMRGTAELPDRHGDQQTTETDKLSTRLLEQSIAAWRRNGHVRVFNQFRGLPVNASARFLGHKGRRIGIGFDAEVARVFASSPDKSTAMLACPDGERQIRASIVRLQAGRAALELQEASYAYIHKRRDVGVQVGEDITVRLSGRRSRRLRARLFDLSISGMGLVLDEQAAGNIHAGDELDCEFSLGGKHFKSTGWVRWQQSCGDMLRLGMEMKSDRTLQQGLQREIFRIQRSIITAMNEIELPDEMQAAIDARDPVSA